MDDQRLQVLDSNKREMFDAMRAYQESERGHKTDAMAMLGALLAATGAVFSALILPEKPLPHIDILSALTAIAATLGAWLIVSKTNAKIDTDHLIYQNFGAEYMRTCDAMGLYGAGAYVPAGAAPIKTARNIGQGIRFEHTKRILTSVGSTLSALSWLAFLVVALGVCSRSNTCTSNQPSSASEKSSSASGK